MKKLPGKTKFSGRRRTMTRKSGFSSHPDSTGGQLKIEKVQSYELKPGTEVRITFEIPPHEPNSWIGFGGWYQASSGCSVSFSDNAPRKNTLTPPSAPDWSKFGTMVKGDGSPVSFQILFQIEDDSIISFYGLDCGVIYHKYIETARDALLGNMHKISPEAHFYSEQGRVVFEDSELQSEVRSEQVDIFLKSCNRCARFLPINIHNERTTLSFSNHCVAEHRRPCTHTGFGKLRNVDTNEIEVFEYGFQLECRFCKKFEVNAAHNPLRTAAQMKEDGARRRAFELLLEELYQGSPQLRYREKEGSELVDDVWETFGGLCFKCGKKLKSRRSMHLDHTRPLALLWPLDESATALCGSCNTAKRDRPPVLFYTNEELVELSEITGIPLDDLRDPSPNIEAIEKLESRIDWFFEEFLTRPDLVKVRDGKVAAELVVKALQKAMNKCPGGAPFDIHREFERRRAIVV